MNILYIADPNSIHDIKWMSFFTDRHKCFLLIRASHAKSLWEENFVAFENQYNIKILGLIEDFSLRKFWQTFSQYKLIKKHILENRIELMHTMYAEPNALWAYFRNGLNVPMVLTTRGTDVLKTIPAFFEGPGIINKLVSYCYKKAFQKTDSITCTSYLQRESLLRMTAERISMPEIIRTGVDSDKILSASSNKIPQQLIEKKYIFFPRAMRPLYFHEFAIEAIANLSPEIRNKYSFVFVDKNSSDKIYIDKIAALMQQTEADFIWLEQLAQEILFQTYKAASLVVMTPKSDGTPVRAVETMLCKVPLILPRLNYDPDIFSEGVCFFEPSNVASLSTLMSLILNAELKLDLNKAFENALNLADREKEMNKLGKLYLTYVAQK